MTGVAAAMADALEPTRFSALALITDAVGDLA